MRDALILILLLIGTVFMFLASYGVVRLPDVFTRMQATSKAATLGVGCVMLSVSIYFGELGVVTRAIGVVLFTFLTAPVASHMIGRAAYISGAEVWKGTVVDELRDKYDMQTHELQCVQEADKTVSETK